MALRRAFVLLIFSVALILGIYAEEQIPPKIFSITPNEGSYMGATRVYINGQGFSSSGNFNSAASQAKLGNKAYFLSDFETVPCDVENDASHETMIVCYTRPMRRDTWYYIQVEVDGVLVPFRENCNRNPWSWRCRFATRWYKTPYLDQCYVTQDQEEVPYPMLKAHAPGDLITCRGRIFTSIYGPNNQTNENGREVSIRRVYAGGQTCDLLKEPDVFHNLKLFNDDGDDGIFTCKTKGSYVGAQNVSIMLTDDFGRNDIDINQMKTNGKDQVYNFQTYAEITSVSPKVGSTEGGTRVTIQGENFDDTDEPITVLIGGEPCDVVEGTMTSDKVECISRIPGPEKDYYIGSRGVVLETWNKTTVDDEITLTLLNNASNYEGMKLVDNTAWKWNTTKDNFVARYTGVFVAPHTDRYKFKIASDDHGSLFMNCEGSKENLTKVAYSNSATSSFSGHGQSSDWMQLTKGQQCYFVSTNREYGGAAHLYVAVLRATTTLTKTQSIDAKNEVQIIDFSAKFLKEKQNINFTSWSRQAGAIEVQEVTVSHSCFNTGTCQNIGYRLMYEGVKTLFIQADASASSVRTHLLNIFALKDENIAVSVATSSGQRKYTVEFRQKRGDYATLGYEKYPSNVQGLSVSISEKTKGVSERKSFKLRLGGRMTAAIAENADVEALDTALEVTRSAYCPPFLLPDLRQSSVITTRDFETAKYGDQWGSRKQDSEAFCGTTSLMNPDIIYRAGRTSDDPETRHKAFDAVQNRWLCLAHRGRMSDRMDLTGTFRGNGKTQTTTHIVTSPLVTHNTEWRYSCIDLISEALHSRSDLTYIDEVTLTMVKFYRHSRDYNYWLDAITIGSSKTTDDLEGVLRVRTPPALANGEPLSKVTIKESTGDRSFEIELDTYNCGNMIPLISIAFISNSAATKDKLTQRESSWESGVSFIATRIQSGSFPMSGKFDLTVHFPNGKSYNVTEIPVDLPVTKFEELLENEVPGFGQANVWRGGSCHARDYGIEWLTNGGDKPLMELRMEDIEGASDITGRIWTSQDGGIFHNPMTGDMLRIAYDKPQVEVFINGYPSKCIANCEFTTSLDSTPIVNSMSPSSGSSHASTSITITGTNLAAISGGNTTVKVSKADCSVTTNTDTQVVCALGDGALGTYDVVLSVGGKGFAKKQNENVSLAFTVSGGVGTISPSSGFSTGGTDVSITGYGFSATTTFTFANKPCVVKSVTAVKVVCTTPKASVSVTDVKITVQDGSVILGSLTYKYVNTDAIVTSISPTTSTLTGGSNLTISGTNLGSSAEMVTVLIAGKSCTVSVWSSTKITCTLPHAPPGQYQVFVVIKGKGYADTSVNSIPPVNYKLEVTSMSPNTGSNSGGTKVTINGNGFTNEITTEVKLGDSICKIESISGTEIVCTSGRTTKTYVVTNNGTHESLGPGFSWDPMTLDINVGDTVTWKWKIDGAPGGWEYGARVFTTSSAESDEYDGVTFESNAAKSAEGSFSYTFNNEGKFYLSSGKVDHDLWGTVIMKGSVNVMSPKSSDNKLSVKVSNHEANYLEVKRKKRAASSCSGEVTSISGCTPTSSTSKFSLTTDPCYTPTITSVSPNNGTTDNTITIKGTGFGTENCANKVLIASGYPDEYECEMISSTSTTIKCKPKPSGNTSINVAYHVKVNVQSLGDTISTIKSDSHRRFTLLPSVKSVSPISGSLGGGALVNIEGSGFSTQASQMIVMFGQYNCIVQTSSYFSIQCLSPISSVGTKVEVTVTISGQTAECVGTCEFEYKNSLTPTITAINPTSVTASDTELVFDGSSFNSDNSKVHVKIGSETCNVTSSTSSKIKCNMAELPAGNHAISVSIDGKGKAKLSGVPATISSPPLITSMTPLNGSKAGGTMLTFVGNGFNSDVVSVKLSNKVCEINKATLTNFWMECETPVLSGSRTRTVVVTSNGQTYSSLQFEYHNDVTPSLTSISPSSGDPGDQVKINGTKLEPNNTKIYVGTAECTNVVGTETSVTCVLGEHVGGTYSVTAKIGILGNATSSLTFNYTFSISSVTPERGSFAGGDILTVSGRGFSSMTELQICNSTCVHNDDMPGTSASSDHILCKLASDPDPKTDSDKVCDISATVDGQSATGASLYTFATDKTPRVTAVSPTRGGTQGGTNITITGTLFDSDPSKVDVTIGGVSCTVTSSSSTEIKCTTNARGKSLKAIVEVTISGKGKALNNDVEFYYVDVWSSKWTWGGQDPPVAGDFVVVPSGQTLVMDVDTPVLKMLLIMGGVVIFDEKDIHVQTENILITDGGVLQIGTEEKPFQRKARITLHGHLRSPELPIYGTKTIGVRNGTLDLHGKHVPITWTHLSETANAGSSTIKLKQAVTWEAGDEIAIASTGDRHSQRENEQKTIKSIAVDKKTITLTEPLEYTHISASETFDGVTVETRAEVGLLTRNIVIEGSKHMEWAKDVIPKCDAGFNTGEFATQTCFQGRFGEEEGSDQFGAQIMIHHRSPDLDIARARIEYVELRHMGQAFRLGRYPIHFHMLGDVSYRNYVRGCAIHKTFNRGITIHKTHHLLIEHNVLFDTMGGTIFIEDGIEHGNKIEYNLVVFCRQSTSLQNDDITPAAFWVTNPNNTLRHNAAAGGTHFGFWYRIHQHPDGPSFDPNICQQLHPMQEFANNTVHSQGWFGLWVFKAYTPKADGSCGSTEPNVVKYDSFTVWNCEKGAELVNVGAIQFHNFIMAANEKAGIETKLVVDKHVKWGQVGTYDSFVIARLSAITTGGSTKRGIILPFTEGYEVNNTKFINFDESGTAAIGVTSIDGTCSVLCGGWEARFSQISFQNSPNKAAFRWEHEVILRDRDGTLSGTGKHSVITPYNPTISKTSCPEIGGFNIGEFPGVICDGSVKFHRLSFNTVNPTSLEAKYVKFTNEYGVTYIPFAKKRLTHKFGWMGTMMDGETYKWVFDSAEQITNISYSSGFYNFEENDCVIVQHNLTQKPDKFFIAGDADDYQKDRMVTCANNYHGDYYFEPNTKTLSYIVSGRDKPSRRKKRAISSLSATPNAVNRDVNFRVYRCFYEKCIPPPDPNNLPPARERPDDVQYWDVTSEWKTNTGEYTTVNGNAASSTPPDNQDIRIEPGTWMVVRQNLPKMNKLWIEGVLEIDWDDEDLSLTLSATHIVIMGGRLIVGWEDATFKGQLSLVLRGDINTQDVELNGGVVVGSKAIGVLGGLDLHGRTRMLTKTHLASAVTAGQNSITLVDSPSDWSVGEEIVIATTSADPWETETFKISEINAKTLTLNATLKFDHMADTFTYTDKSGVEQSYDIRAEVALLTRNIKVIGEDYNDLYTHSFGARVLVAGVGSTRGYARVQNVEFYHTGQEGFIDNYDPRYSLAFLNTGSVDTIKPSSVKRNVFHHGFNTAIGVFGASLLEVKGNIIHHTVGPAIRVEGDQVRVEDNLAMLVRTRSVYQDRMEDDIMLWKAAIEVNLATAPVISDNVVAGSERGGYRIDGHNCDDTSTTGSVTWGTNTARACLQGIWMNKDGFPSCSLISKFNIHSAYDYAVYYQGSGSVKMSELLITDSPIGIVPIVYAPASLSHAMQNKYVHLESSTIVAVSKADYCPTLPTTTDYVQNSVLARAKPRTGANDKARAGVLWPIFISGQNAAPSKPFVGSLSYPAIGGQTILKDLTFVNFGETTCSSDHSAIMTNLKIEDFLHPISVSGLHFVNSPEDSRLFIHRPSIGAINPSDCVDMECDGMKKALIKDTDGSLLGSPGSAIPQAEYEWDGDPRRGLGDYRIPKTMLTKSDGSRIPVDEIVPNKGILRANTSDATCTLNQRWQAWKCLGYKHGILVIESLDDDTETRRLSPVGLMSNSYIDLNNGPQDHGWCAGYTCQERLSTFWTIVAFEKTYEMHFSGTNPQKLKLRMLNEEATTKMVMKIFYTRPQRLDIYVDNKYVKSTNSRTNENGQDVLAPPPVDSPAIFKPNITNDVGTNYFDRAAKIIHITLSGETPVLVKEAEVVVITFNLPAVSPDEFFDNGKLIQNLALFLDIPESKIRLVNAVREGSTSGRKRRAVESYSATVEIGDPPAATVEESTSTSNESTTAAPGTGGTTPASISLEDLARTTSSITNALQQGTLAKALETEVDSLSVVDPREPPVRNANITNTTDTDEDQTIGYFVPAGLKVVQQPAGGNAESVMLPTLQVTGIDNAGNNIVLGHKGDQWQATVTIQSGDTTAKLSGTTIAKFDKGIASFENLTISLAGSFVLKITVTYPIGQTALNAVTDPFTLSEAIVTTKQTPTTVKVDPVPPPVSNLAVIIACSVVGGLLLIAVIVIIVLKGPCSSTYTKNASSPAPYSQSSAQPSPTRSTELSNIDFEHEESQHPHSVIDDTKSRPPSYKKSPNPYDNVN
uniref:fibrocystin-L-like n=1 Tax=Styela clava TaxID=7725 RepID=UPI00193AA8E2|nr:fibrocystin-L-like [Styela clava]